MMRLAWCRNDRVVWRGQIGWIVGCTMNGLFYDIELADRTRRNGVPVGELE